MSVSTVSYTRRTLTRAQRAEAAARNVGSFGKRTLAQLTVELIAEAAGSGSVSLPASTRAASSAKGATVRTATSNGLSVKTPDDVDAIRKHLLTLASPTQNDDVLIWIANDWLQDGLDRHTEALEQLRIRHPAMYQALIEGRLRSVARLGTKAKLPRSFLECLLEDHARFLLVGTAHGLIAFVRQLATDPYAGSFSGFNQWKSAAHILLSTTAEPAITVVDVLSRAVASDDGDDATREVLTGAVLLPSDTSGNFVWDTALEVRSIMSARGLTADQLLQAGNKITSVIAPAAALTNRDMANAGLSHSSMSAFWFGIEPAEAATYVAIELIKALGAVEAMVAATLDGRRIEAPASSPSNAKIAFGAALLRAEGQPDREAGQLGVARGGDGGLNPGNKASRGPLASLQVKLGDPAIAAAAAQAFGLDATTMFRR